MLKISSHLEGLFCCLFSKNKGMINLVIFANCAVLQVGCTMQIQSIFSFMEEQCINNCVSVQIMAFAVLSLFIKSF